MMVLLVATVNDPLCPSPNPNESGSASASHEPRASVHSALTSHFLMSPFLMVLRLLRLLQLALGGDDDEVHAAVGRASLRGLVVRDGPVRPVAHRLQARRLHALAHEVVLHCLGPRQRQLAI